jgi:hypothetical protein
VGVYLGLKFDGSASPVAMAQHRAQALSTAAMAGYSSLRAAGCRVPQTPQSLLKVMHTRAEPAGLYGCELWGLHYAQASSRAAATRQARQDLFYALSDPVEQVRCASLRRWFRVPQDVPRGCQPLVHTYILRAVQLYNRLLQVGGAWKAALQQNVADGICWQTHSCKLEHRPVCSPAPVSTAWAVEGLHA